MNNLLTAVTVFCLMGAVSCGKSEAPKPAPAAVTVSTPIERDVIEWNEYSGHLESPKTVTLAARISGVILQAPFEEGSLVHEGDVIYVIDDRPFKADLESKQASVQRAEALLAQAQVHFNRYSKIRETKAISAEDFDQAVASLKQAQAEIAAAKAAEDASKLNFEWTKVRAPITGRISRKFITEGNLVNGGAGQATPLTVILSVDPLYATVTVPEEAFLRYQQLGEERNRKPGQQPKIPCGIKLQGQPKFNRACDLNFIDSRVDPNTGTVLLRANIPNADGHLTPGLFIRMEIPGSDAHKALLVPDSAVSTDQNTRVVFVLAKDNAVEQRKITSGALFGRMRAIQDGLKPGEKIIVNGIQSARPGSTVSPQDAELAPDVIASIEPFLAVNEHTAAATKKPSEPEAKK